MELTDHHRKDGGSPSVQEDAASAALGLRPPRNRVDRRAIAWWVLGGLVRTVPVLAGLGVTFALWPAARPWLGVPMVLVAVIAVVHAGIEPAWRYAVHRWEVGDTATYALSGWVVREWRVAPTTRVQTVDAVRGPIEQLLGLATLRVTTASSYGTIKIGGLDAAVAEDAAAHLASVAELIPGDAT